MKPLFFIKLADGVELAVAFVTRERTDAFHLHERETTIPEAIAGLRALPPLLSQRVATASHLESERPE